MMVRGVEVKFLGEDGNIVRKHVMVFFRAIDEEYLDKNLKERGFVKKFGTWVKGNIVVEKVDYEFSYSTVSHVDFGFILDLLMKNRERKHEEAG